MKCRQDKLTSVLKRDIFICLCILQIIIIGSLASDQKYVRDMLMNFDYLVSQLYVQPCAFVEIGEGVCSLFVELAVDNNKKPLIKQIFFGNCLCSEFRTWQLCSHQLAQQRPEDCEFNEGVPCSSSARVHRRLCDVTGMSQWNPQCNCSTPLAGELQEPMCGFRTCHSNPMPASICTPRTVCGTAHCDTGMHGSLYSVKCDRKCKNRQSFCERTGPRTSEKRSVVSQWSSWKGISNVDNSNIQQYEADCLDSSKNHAFDCLGPGLLCCSEGEMDCICEVKLQDGALKAFRYVVMFPSSVIKEPEHSSMQVRSAGFIMRPGVWNRFLGMDYKKNDQDSVSLFDNFKMKKIKNQDSLNSEAKISPGSNSSLFQEISLIINNSTKPKDLRDSSIDSKNSQITQSFLKFSDSSKAIPQSLNLDTGYSFSSFFNIVSQPTDEVSSRVEIKGRVLPDNFQSVTGSYNTVLKQNTLLTLESSELSNQYLSKPSKYHYTPTSIPPAENLTNVENTTTVKKDPEKNDLDIYHKVNIKTAIHKNYQNSEMKKTKYGNNDEISNHSIKDLKFQGENANPHGLKDTEKINEIQNINKIKFERRKQLSNLTKSGNSLKLGDKTIIDHNNNSKLEINNKPNFEKITDENKYQISNGSIHETKSKGINHTDYHRDKTKTNVINQQQTNETNDYQYLQLKNKKLNKEKSTNLKHTNKQENSLQNHHKKGFEPTRNKEIELKNSTNNFQMVRKLNFSQNLDAIKETLPQSGKKGDFFVTNNMTMKDNFTSGMKICTKGMTNDKNALLENKTYSTSKEYIKSNLTHLEDINDSYSFISTTQKSGTDSFDFENKLNKSNQKKQSTKILGKSSDSQNGRGLSTNPGDINSSNYKTENEKKITTHDIFSGLNVGNLHQNSTSRVMFPVTTNEPNIITTYNTRLVTNKLKVSLKTMPTADPYEEVKKKYLKTKEILEDQKDPIPALSYLNPILPAAEDIMRSKETISYDEPEPVLKELDSDNVDDNTAEALNKIVGLKTLPENVKWVENKMEDKPNQQKHIEKTGTISTEKITRNMDGQIGRTSKFKINKFKSKRKFR